MSRTRTLLAVRSRSQHGLLVFCTYVILMSIYTIHAQKHDRTCGTLTTPGVTIPSGDIVLHEGDSLNIYCQLSDWYMKRPGHLNASDLVFFRDKQLIPPAMTQVINSSTVQLNIQNMTESSSIYYCKFTNLTAVCLNKVAVGSEPKKVQNLTCVSRNWLNLTCTWRVPSNYVATQYRLIYKLPGRAGRGVEYPCPDNQPIRISEGVYQCFWNLSTKPHYRQSYKTFCFTMTGTNVFGLNVQKMDFNHYAHVIPDRPLNLTLVNKTTHSAFIAWSIDGPMINFQPGLNHRIMYQSQYDTRDSWHTLEVSKLTPIEHFFVYELRNLEYAHTYYDIRVQMQSSDARGEDWWSQFSSVTIRTKSELPFAAPRTDVGSFEISGGAHHRDIYIYWQQIKESQQNGENFLYKIAVKENGHYKNIIPNETTASYAKFKMLQEYEYEFDVYSTNEIGNSSQYSKVRVPSTANGVKEPISFTKIAFEERTYELSWKAPDEPNVTSYTVFWCKNERDRPYQCTGFLNWTRVDSHVRFLNQTVEDNSIYQFAISANTATGRSSGMVWASCTVIHNKFVGKMKNVWISEIDARMIKVGWKLDCSDRIGIVITFRIYYCAIRIPDRPVCIEPERSIEIQGDLNTMYGIVNGLRPYTTYRISVSVVTKTGEGQRSDMKLNTTLEAAPDTPRNLRIVNVSNSSAFLQWDTPTEMNGVLRYYLVKYENTDRKVEAVPNAKQSNITLTDLRSFSFYRIKVSACTNSCSPPLIGNVTTRIGVPGIMLPPTIMFMNESQMTMNWIAPEVLGGPHNYELRLERSQDGEVSSCIFNTTGNNLTIPTTECEKEGGPRILFKWSVRSVTINEDGARLEGPWSEVVSNFCRKSGSSNVLISCLLVTSLIICLCISAFYIKKAWIRCQSMRNVEVKLPPGLTPAGVGADTIVTHAPLKLTKERIQEDSHILHIIAADEQRLLEKKREFDSEMECISATPQETSGCNSGSDSITSSIGTTPVTTIDREDTDVADKDNCSLRLRNVPSKPSFQDLSLNHHMAVNTAWTKPYVTMPAPEKVDSFTGTWTKPTKNIDGYSQIGVETNQPKILPPSGYVPHPMMNNPPLTGVIPTPITPQAPPDDMALMNEDECENEECPRPELSPVSVMHQPLIFPPFDDDLININENLDQYNVKVTDEDVMPYVSLSTAMARGSGPKIAEPKPSSPSQSDVFLTGNKPTTPNPYSRVGTWDSTAISPISPSSYIKLGTRSPSTNEESNISTPEANPPCHKSNYVPHRQFDCKLLKED